MNIFMVKLKFAVLTILAVFFGIGFVSAEGPTTSEVEAKVDQAIAMLKAEGIKGFDKLRDKNGEFVFKGTYIWVHDEDGKMIVHPIKPAMEGNSLMGLQDVAGKKFFVAMNALVKSKGNGWVEYLWPKPETTAPVRKVSYVKGVQVDGKNLIVGCGIYDVSDADVAKLTAQ